MSEPVCIVEALTAALQKTHVCLNGVTFAGKSLKLDTKSDAKQVTAEINNCTDLQYLNLEGNTLGVEASKHIAKALEKHPEFKRALWKDMFTGRLKEEIPKALEFLGNGLVIAGARLVELDLSDNAFGPIGVKGLASLLKSSSCYALEELKLNNNGLGITGGKLLASALTDCYNCSKREGKPLALKVFVAGRNRLENEGATVLAEVFKMIGTLEEITMPQNGIYHVGISALSVAFIHNKNLKILNLNDNTIGAKGAKAITDALPHLQSLQQINFGDCLLKTKGALLLANALQGSHVQLEVLILSSNEIKKDAGLQIVNALSGKKSLKILDLDANQFGEDGLNEVKHALQEIGKVNVLGSMDENESDDGEESDESNSDDEVEEDENESKDSVEVIEGSPQKKIEVKDFLAISSADNFLALGPDRVELILDETKIKTLGMEDYIKVLMKTSALCRNTHPDVANSAIKVTEILYRDLFVHSSQNGDISIINNTILVHFGLIKSEDKKFKPTYNLDGCYFGLNSVLTKNYIPQMTRDALKIFISKSLESCKEFLTIKTEVLSNLK